MELLGSAQSASDEGQTARWSPDIFGLDKRKLLQTVVLKRFSDKHQKVRRLKGEILNILDSMQSSSVSL